MPVFNAKIMRTEIFTIVMSAENEDAAMEYLRKTRQYMEDGRFEHEPDETTLTPVSVTQVTHPSQLPPGFEGGTLCWGPHEEWEPEAVLAFALYGYPQEPSDELCDDDDESEEGRALCAQWEEHRLKEVELKERFKREYDKETIE